MCFVYLQKYVRRFQKHWTLQFVCKDLTDPVPWICCFYFFEGWSLICFYDKDEICNNDETSPTRLFANLNFSSSPRAFCKNRPCVRCWTLTKQRFLFGPQSLLNWLRLLGSQGTYVLWPLFWFGKTSPWFDLHRLILLIWCFLWFCFVTIVLRLLNFNRSCDVSSDLLET